tara:strand:+ start:223 stop:465 length:243 start_codon:yes stop_codon:yes gene_type:complete
MFGRIKNLMEQQFNRRKTDPPSPSWSRVPSSPVGQTEKSSANLELIRKTIRERKKRIKARKRAEEDKVNRKDTPNRGGSL